MSITERNLRQSEIFLSVIVTAHDRREFIIKALDSIKSQTLSRDSYEVIVVKNYKDDKIDSYIGINGFKSIVTNATPVGEKLSMAVGISKGNVITVLEDDDEYTEDRLKAIYDVFTNTACSTYFENTQSYIDSDGTALPRVDTLKNEGNIYIENSEITTEKFIMFRKDPAGNASCMAISKEILVNHLEESSKIWRSQDAFILFLGLSYSKIIVRDWRKLTRQRVHVSATKLPGNLTRDTYLIEKNQREKRNYDDWKVIAGLTIGTNVHRIATLQFNFRKFLSLLYSNDRKTAIYSLKYILRLATFVGIKNETFYLLIWSVYMVSPSFLGKIAYLHYKSSLG